MTISTRAARRLREKVWWNKRKEVRFQDLSAEFHREWAEEAIIRIKKKLTPLTPAQRLALEQRLAYWEAALDSLDDDGVLPDPKGQD